MTITTEEAEIFAVKCSVLGMAKSASALRSLAAERDALRAENARLREVLQSILPYAGGNSGGGGGVEYAHRRQEIISHAWALVKGEKE